MNVLFCWYCHGIIRSHATGQLIWILLFFAFTACVIAALLQGAMVYSNITDVLNDEFSIHTGLNYVQSRIHSGDAADCVYVGEFDGLSALYFEETGDDGVYTTIIYDYGGSMSRLAGLCMQSTAPRRKQLDSTSPVSSAVRNITGIFASAASAFSFLITSKPVISGMN